MPGRGQHFCVPNHMPKLVLSSNRDHVTGAKDWAEAILKCGCTVMSILQMRNTEAQKGREPTQGFKRKQQQQWEEPLSRALAMCSPLAGDAKVASLSTEEKQMTGLAKASAKCIWPAPALSTHQVLLFHLILIIPGNQSSERSLSLERRNVCPSQHGDVAVGLGQLPRFPRDMVLKDMKPVLK